MRFIDYALDYLNKSSDELAPLTVRTYYWNLKKIEYFCPGLECKDLTPDFVRDFKQHLESLRNKEATVVKALSVLRVFCNKMKADGVINCDTFEKVKIRRAYSHRGFLTLRELKHLYLSYMESHVALTRAEDDVMRVFLFSCFTGLRYGDLRTLDASEIFDWKIRKQMHKTGEAVYIPIPVQARLLLSNPLTSGRIFHVIDNASFNRTLRKAAKKLGYYKHIHCHLARHTFATTCITIGIPLPATSKLLGHRNLDTTLIYAKYVDTFLDKEMKKFNRLK
ncbi:site-specific integrase [Fibrobacter sp. UWB12]|uniref:site-specific integrase n=1 Tax=Fibrobacter sp. UWB12 TaxID=1896203 RepID=UPI00091DBAD6|nr:site-specific integrase [Fibrobacter sp. UWB12]SHK40536.1 Site-specific recombinase XerD [Fibrobacter sp. UWB12]